MNCIFCKIINKEAPADIVYEDEKIIAFKSIEPKCPVHILIVPKKHIVSINEISEEDRELIGEMLLIAKKIAGEKQISSGYRLIFNVGKDSGQTVDHLHLHLLGGNLLSWE